MTQARAAFGTLLQLDDGVGNYTTIAEVQDISGPQLSLDTTDVTSHSSTGGWEEHLGTLLRSGQITFTVNYVPTSGTHNNTTGLMFLMRSRIVRNFKIIFTDGSSSPMIFPALVAGLSASEPVGGALTASITLKVTGVPTLV